MKLEGRSQLGLLLEFHSETNKRTLILLASNGDTLDTMNQFSSKFSKVIMPHSVTKLKAAPGWVILENTISMNGNVLVGIHAVCYISHPESHRTQPTNLRQNQPTFMRFLGILGFLPRNMTHYFIRLVPGFWRLTA